MDLLARLPKVTYNGAHAVNLTARVEIYKKLLKKYPAFYDYSIKDGERPDTVAYDYYGSENYAWLVMLCANVYNVYTDWPLGYHDFIKYLVKKYGNITTIQSTPAYYRYTGIGGSEEYIDVARKSWRLSPTSFNALSSLAQSGWTAVTIYQMEDELNESKRTIKLLSNLYIDQVDRELEAMFS